MTGPDWLVFSSIAGRLAQAGLCSVGLQDGWPSLALLLMQEWPILVFSSYILEGRLKLHFPMFSKLIGRMAFTGLYLVVLLYNWPMLAIVQCF